MTRRLVMTGIGGIGRAWCSHFLKPFIESGRVEPVAAVDLQEDALAYAREALGLPASACFTDYRDAFASVTADVCVVATTPAAHEPIACAAVEAGLDVLCEKPLSDDLVGAVRMAQAVGRTGRKLGVTQSHRFEQDKQTLRAELRSGRHGPLDCLIFRSNCAMRSFGSWGRFRHEIPDVQMIEGGVHHLDILSDLAQSDVTTIYARTWTPRWSEYAGDCNALAQMEMRNGVLATYESSKSVAATMDCFTREHVRAECERSTVVLSARTVEVFGYPSEYEPGAGEAVPLLEGSYWGHQKLIDDFLNWVDGGPPMQTEVEANLRSVATMFAGIESSRTREPVDVDAFLKEAVEAAS